MTNFRQLRKVPSRDGWKLKSLLTKTKRVFYTSGVEISWQQIKIKITKFYNNFKWKNLLKRYFLGKNVTQKIEAIWDYWVCWGNDNNRPKFFFETFRFIVYKISVNLKIVNFRMIQMELIGMVILSLWIFY